MNHFYRLIWNELAQTWVAAAELAKAHGRHIHGGASPQADPALVPVVATLRPLYLAMYLVGLVPASTLALPTGEQLAGGGASFQRNNNQLNIKQTSQAAVVNWQSFSIARGEQVSISQPNSAATMLARVQGMSPSTIDGVLQANGRLYLINPNGILVGPSGIIDTAHFMASTLDVSDGAFMSGSGMNFSGDGQAGVVNLGTIRASEGDVSLVAHSVRNAGTISAPKGAANLLAANEIFLASPDAPALLVRAGGAGTATGVENSGLIEAAQARLQAADGNIYALAINQSGVIRAVGVETRDGRIVLTASGGKVVQDGKLFAHHADGSGGEILVGGDYHGGNAQVANAAETVVTAKARLEADATSSNGDGGRVIVWADNSTQFDGRISARAGSSGGDGGFAEVSGKHDLRFRPAAPVDLSAPSGRTGTLLLDPDQIDVVTTASTANQLAVATIQSGLASANYVLDTSGFKPANGSGDITFSNNVSWTSGNTLSVTSGNNININANISGVNGTLALYHGKSAMTTTQGLPPLSPSTTLNAANSIDVATLRVGLNNNAPPTGYTARPSSAFFRGNGVVTASALELDLNSGSVSVNANNAANALDAVRTLGTGDLGGLIVKDGSGNLNVKLASSNSSTNWIDIATPGTLTLESGSSLSFANPATVVLASTGGNFVNQAGGSVFGSKARYLIYTNTTAATTKGGLTGVEVFSRSYVGNPPTDAEFSDTTSRILFSSGGVSPELTYRANDLSRYYGDANPALSYAVSGLQGGDVLSAVVSGAPVLSSSATLASGVNTYAIQIGRGTLSSASYGFNFVNGTLTVNPAPLTMDIHNASRYYGDLNPTFGATVTGLKNGETAASILAGWSLGTAATRASNVGGYPIQAAWLGSGSTNYSYTVHDGTFTINAAPVTVTLAPTARIYGDANPDFRALASLSGTYNGDTVANAFPASSFTTSATAASSVGSYAVSAGGFNNPNYQVTIGSIAPLTINKALLTVNANNASRPYGDADPAFSVAAFSGFRNGDNASAVPGLALVSNTTGSTVVGSYPIVPTGSATNYEFVAGTGTLAIDKARVEVHLNPATRYYGDPDPVFSASYVGLKNGETSMPGLSPQCSSTIHSPAGSYAISADGITTFQNYLPTFYGALLTIAPRPITVTANNATRTYGYENPNLSVTVDNATSWDAAQAAKYWVASTTATSRSDAGSYPITASANPYGDRFDNLANYAVTLKPGTFSVTRAPLSIVANPVSMLWGNGLPPLTYTVDGGIMPWDSKLDTSGIALTSQAGGTAMPPGQYPITLAHAEGGKNYQAVLSIPTSVTVQKRPITIYGNFSMAGNELNKVFPGQMDPLMVTTYQDGMTITTAYLGPIPGGPQFKVLAGTDGTRVGAIDSLVKAYVTTAYVEPTTGYTLADVLRYYDPVSRPGVANANLLSSETIVRNITLPPSTIPFSMHVTASPATVTFRDPTPPGEAPSVRNLAGDLLSDKEYLTTALTKFKNTESFRHLGLEERTLILDALAGDPIWQSYKKNVDATEAWIAKVKTERPSGWEMLVANAEADIAKWRNDMAKTPSLENLRLRVQAGDAVAARALVPIMATAMMKSLSEGTLAGDTSAALMQLINGQRAEIIEKADAKFNSILSLRESSGGLLNLFAAPKIPDIVGQAFIEVADSRRVTAERTGGIVGSVVGGGIVAGSMMTEAALVTGFGTLSTSTLVSEFGAATALGGPAVIVAVAVAIGVAEANAVAESTKNYERYQAYKDANKPLASLNKIDLSNKDNLAQVATAIQTLLAQSFGKMGS
ncbi:MAG: MBG domain-containing protein [Rhodoferax sp.]|uniref:MBG domain-containing protein n=1 Tax=Rhodoferax sp. TaxID=50421 RepID=UPI002627EFCF|nr:MBG domain-containing protein [Rhodoferax sp.]MDD5333956.1 MBG domain-containing protein [Rhodoferax sp.]